MKHSVAALLQRVPGRRRAAYPVETVGMPPAASRSYWRHKLRRTATVLLVFAVVVVGGYAAARHTFEQRLQAMLRVLDERHPSWRLDDLERGRAPIPDGENAAVVVRALADRLPEKFTQGFFAGAPLPLHGDPLGRSFAVRAIPPLPGRERLTPQYERLLRPALVRTDRVAQDARALAGFSQGRYTIEHHPAYSRPSPDALGIRQLNFLLRHDALLQIHEGMHREALLDGRAILVAGRSLGDEPAPAYQMMRLECWDEALAVVDRVLAHGRAAGDDLQAMQRLLELEAAAPVELYLLQGELAMCHQRFAALEAGELQLFASRRSPPVGRVLDRLARDVVKLWHAGMLDYLSRRAEAARLPEPEQAAALRRLDQEVHAESPLGTWLGELRSRRLLAQVGNGRVRLQAAAAALAAERYRLQEGRWPDGLAALVPAFLPRVPQDPYTQQPLVYRKTRDGLVIYSVGANGRDDQGHIQSPADSLGADIGFRLWDEAGR